jgi:hypothetical protein
LIPSGCSLFDNSVLPVSVENWKDKISKMYERCGV